MQTMEHRTRQTCVSRSSTSSGAALASSEGSRLVAPTDSSTQPGLLTAAHTLSRSSTLSAAVEPAARRQAASSAMSPSARCVAFAMPSNATFARGSTSSDEDSRSLALSLRPCKPAACEEYDGQGYLQGLI